VRELRQAWTRLRKAPFPGGAKDDANLHEIALYDAWLEPMVTASLARGRLSAAHGAMLEQRRAEGNQAVWAAAGNAGDAARAYVARLLQVEERLRALALD
jgi:hypothetical protein